MLCDAWLAQVHALHKDNRLGFFPVAPEESPPIETLKRAQRFVLAPDAVRVVGELANDAAVERVRHAAIAPADETWLEWTDAEFGQVGLLLQNSRLGAPAIAGDGIFIIQARTTNGSRCIVPLPFGWNLHGPGPAIEFQPGAEALALGRRAFPGLFERLDFGRIGAWLVATLSLIATPRLTMMREPDLARLNKKRRRLGRAEFLPNREITLALGSDAEQSAWGDESEDERVGRALHHVRAHYRLIPGGVTLVRQHWRGDARFGTTKQRHTIRAQSDTRP